MKEVTDQISRCTECEVCMDVCPTYVITGKSLFSPMHRLKTAKKLFDGEKVDEQMVESLYNCAECRRCETVCPQGIEITEIVSTSRNKLVERGLGPLEKHNKIIGDILSKGNAVNGDPQKRLDWLPEKFPKGESDTLLYLGCLSSYFLKDIAVSSYLVLKKLDFDFMLLKDEGCCGIYLYESGRFDLAKEIFQKNVKKFESLGVRRIVTPCNGCMQCFKYHYPALLGKINFSVHHIVEVIYDLLKRNPEVLKKTRRIVTYQDPCRLARLEGITEEPREILKWCGAELKEMEENRKDAPCCGAGGGIRSVYRDLSMEMASNLLSMTKAETIVSTCPFCTFNLNYTSRKKELEKSVSYFTNLVLESLG
jgi:heterodisulfide reductase subunit D